MPSAPRRLRLRRQPACSPAARRLRPERPPGLRLKKKKKKRHSGRRHRSAGCVLGPGIANTYRPAASPTSHSAAGLADWSPPPSSRLGSALTPVPPAPAPRTRRSPADRTYYDGKALGDALRPGNVTRTENRVRQRRSRQRQPRHPGFTKSATSPTASTSRPTCCRQSTPTATQPPPPTPPPDPPSHLGGRDRTDLATGRARHVGPDGDDTGIRAERQPLTGHRHQRPHTTIGP